MIEKSGPFLPNEGEYLRRKTILERSFIEHTCPLYNLDPQKTHYAIKEGILRLEPSFLDWESDDWAEGSINWDERFDLSCLNCESDKMMLPSQKSFLQTFINKFKVFKKG